MKQTIKTEALINAKNALKAYLQKNRLSPLIDWRKDKIHGKEVTRLVNRLNLERDKVLDNYPYNDIKNETKTIVMSKDKKKVLKKKVAATAPEAAPKKEAKKEVKEAPKKAVTSKYDYPLVDGREMTKEEKKKYRAEQRKAANGGAPKEKKEAKKEKPAKEAPKAAKKAKKEAKLPEKPLKEGKDKKKALKKKVKKDED